MTNVPAIVEEASIFADCLRNACAHDGTWGEVFTLEHKASALVFDVLARFSV